MIYLASASPRRRELILNIPVPSKILNVQVPEPVIPGEAPWDMVQRLAMCKAKAGVQLVNEQDIVIGADTTVALDSQVLGKPRDAADACRMLATLSGRTHQVYTGVALASEGGVEHCFFEKTDVTFRQLSQDEIKAYVATGEPMDKAGAYGIQKFGSLLVERIHGDYFNVVGLPVCALYQALKQATPEAAGKYGNSKTENA